MPPGDWLVGAPWEAGALVQCRQYFEPALATPTLKVVVPLGATALDQVLNLSGLQGIQVKNFHGTVTRDPLDRFWVVPTFHPSHLQRGAMNLLEVVTGDLKLASKIAQHGFTRSPATLVVDPHPIWFGQWVDAHVTGLQREDIWLAVDTEFEGSAGKDEDEITEGATLTRVNVANRQDEGVTVPFREPYISHLKRLFGAGGWTYWWNKDVDLDMLREGGIDLRRGTHIDLMWCLEGRCFVPTWEGKHYTIREIVEKQLPVTLVGMDEEGTRIPVKIQAYHRTVVRRQKFLHIHNDVTREITACTPDHRIWTRGGWKRADELKRGDEIPIGLCGSDDLIHGTILGDGHVTRAGQLTLDHGAPQRAWAQAKATHLGVPVYESARTWVLVETPVGRRWRRKFYREDGSRLFVPPSDAALAVWYADDGSYHRNPGFRGLGAALLACHRHGPETDKILAWLTRRFGPGVTKQEERPGQYTLVLHKQACRRFFAAIAPWLHPSMAYKVNEAYRGQYNGWLERSVPRWARVTVVTHPRQFIPAMVRYCVTVDHPTHRFFTRGGLVSNCWHYVQSDLPRGLGFVAPFYSDFGPWKHWAKIPDQEGSYAAADALQTYRCTGIVADAQALGVWEVFLRECHDRDQMVLKPASAVGVPIDRPALEAFHVELQGKLTTLLEKMQATTAEGCLKPKAGYAKKPKGDPPVPPKSIFGAKKKGVVDGPDAKLDYLVSHTVLVERLVEVDSLCCETCQAEGVTAKHRCKTPKKPRRKKTDRLDLLDAGGDAADGVPPALSTGVSGAPTPALVTRRLTVPHWYWRVPFNPDARAQLLAYIESTGRELPRDRKTGKTSTSKKSVTALLKTSGDVLYQLILDWKAVQKVDSTYALATLNRIDADNRLHSTFTFAPSTLRDSSKNPNLQNVVSRGEDADLASGFRRCVQARDGVPPSTSTEVLASWEEKYARGI